MAPDAAGKGSAPAELGVLISAGAGEPERLVMLAPPAGGRVHLREWSTHNWTGAPDERDLPVDQAFAIFRQAHDARREMTMGLTEIRAWLDGLAR